MPADVSQFLAAIAASQAKAIPAIAAAVDEFGDHVLGDAQQLCPVDTGALQASATVGQLPASIEGDLVSKTIGFNTDYAAAVHERLTNYFSGKVINHPMGQAKFLEIAMTTNGPKLNGFVAKRLGGIL